MWVDAIALSIVGVLAVSGWRKGLVASAIGTVGFLFAIWAGARYSGPMADYIGAQIPLQARYGIAFLVVLLGVVVAVAIIGRVISSILNASPLGSLDGIAGAAIGALKGVILVSILAVVLSLLPVPDQWTATYVSARSVRVAMSVTGWVVRGIEPYVSEPMGRFIDAVQHYLDSLPSELLRDGLPSLDGTEV
jgi:uncharacterized membrane protein required for colicin V production